MKRRWWVAVVAVGLVVTACGPTHGVHGTSTTMAAPTTVVAHTTGPTPSMHLTPAVSYRSDPAAATRRRLATLAYLATLPNTLKLGPVTTGSSIETSWCVPKSASYCLRAMQTQANIQGPGLVVTAGGDIYGGEKNPPTFGNTFSAQNVPDAAGQIALSINYSEAGGSITGDGWEVEFVYLTPALRAAILDIEPVDYFDLQTIDAAAGNELDFGATPTYTTGSGATIGLTADAPTALASLGRYLGSAQELRSRFEAREAQLLRQVISDIDKGLVAKQVDCKSSRNGLPPICGIGPLNSADKAREITRAKAQIDSDEEFVARHYQQMYTVLTATLDWNTCRSCWS